MPDTAVRHSTSAASMNGETSQHDLEHIVAHAAHLLPSQGPLAVFVHHNTLHAFEDLTFAEAVVKAAGIFGCQPYLAEERYRAELVRGRIRVEDLTAVLHDDLREHGDDLIGMLGTRYYLRAAMMQVPLFSAPAAELRWVVAETEALRKFRVDAPAESRDRAIESTRRWIMRDYRNGHRGGATSGATPAFEGVIAEVLESFDAGEIERWSEATWEAVTLQLLWRICCHGAALGEQRPAVPNTYRRHRDVLLDRTGVDSDDLVHEFLIRFSAAFLDQGFGHWPLPDREQGYYRSFLELYGATPGVLPRWLHDLRRESGRLLSEQVSPLESIDESLSLLGVDAADREPFITASLLALGGWAGMMWQMESNAEWAVHPAPRGSLIEFLAVRLLLDRFAIAHVAQEELEFRGPLQDVRSSAVDRPPGRKGDPVLKRAFAIFQLAQVLGWKPEDLQRLTPGTWLRLIDEIESFSGFERRRIFHLAYERRYRNQTLDAISAFANKSARKPPASADAPLPLFQIVCCIDEREESFRRHLEEAEPAAETLSCAGFFAVAMYYRGVAEAHSRPLCPVVIKPQHYVEELPMFTFEDSHRRRARTRRLLGSATHRIHLGSRSLIGGAVTALFGSIASIPLVARILFPRTAAQIRRLFGRFVEAPPVTQLLLERTEAEPGPSPGHIGYSVEEMANVVERILRDLGLTSRFARLVVICGHGSSSMNNPHESAHDCGACGGGRGGPNARAFAHMANDPRIRELLARRGLAVPADVVFLGAYHNTCDDSVTYYDLDRLPLSHREVFDRAHRAIDEARQRNAHERCRRFESAPLSLSAEMALRHVESRSEDLAQVRPEYGHATNSVCIVGRRSRTRGMYLDRRSFLNSYDPTQDNADSAILTRILQAVIPVCAGINLEYYFSFTDPRGWGCGTKLPHNITSLLGVMDGAASDLRPGLPWQMVEVHEPVRILFIIETTPAAMLQILERNPALATLCRNDWVQLATLDPNSSRIDLFHHGEFVPYEPESGQLPEVATSADWYRGWRDHLGYASLKS